MSFLTSWLYSQEVFYLKNKLKQILLIVSMVLTLLLSCVPLAASAASVSQVGDKYTITLAEMQKENAGQYYLYYKAANFRRDIYFSPCKIFKVMVK